MTGVLVVGTVGVGGVSGKALGGAALCVALGVLLNVISVVRKEDVSERYHHRIAYIRIYTNKQCSKIKPDAPIV